MIRRLNGDARGATLVEFALLAPVFFMFLIGMIEGSRMLWMQQALQETAFGAARCMGLGVAACNSVANTRNFAVARAGDRGVVITAANVTPQTNVTCGTTPGLGRVRIELPFQPVAAQIVPLAATLVGEACFPTLAD